MRSAHHQTLTPWNLLRTRGGLPLHLSGEAQCLLPLCGEFELIGPAEAHRLRRGGVFFLQGEGFRLHASADARIVQVRIPVQERPWLEPVLTTGCFDQPGIARETLQQLRAGGSIIGPRLRSLLQQWRTRCPGRSAVQCRRRLLGLLSARRALHAICDSALDLARLAVIAGLSTCHFVRTYRRVFGIPPMQESRRADLFDAHRRLRSGEEPIRRLAEDAGFSRAATFSRALRRHFGASASVLRQKVNCCVAGG